MIVLYLNYEFKTAKLSEALALQQFQIKTNNKKPKKKKKITKRKNNDN